MDTQPGSETIDAPSYGFTTKLTSCSLADARGRVEAVLKEQGFGVLTEIDVQATLKKKLGAEFRPYVILGACNPQLAHRALSGDLGVGLLLPCNPLATSERPWRVTCSRRCGAGSSCWRSSSRQRSVARSRAAAALRSPSSLA